MHSTVQLKPITDAFYVQGATDKNTSSDRPLGKLLTQMGNLRSGKASQANLRSDLKGEQQPPGCQAGCAEKGGGVAGSPGRGNSRDKVPEEGEEA